MSGLDQDHGDVVPATVRVGDLDESIGRLFRIWFGGEHLSDEILVDLINQAVGAEQETVGVGEWHLPQVDLDIGVDTERAGHDVAPGMMSSIIGGEEPVVDQLLNQ